MVLAAKTFALSTTDLITHPARGGGRAPELREAKGKASTAPGFPQTQPPPLNYRDTK